MRCQAAGHAAEKTQRDMRELLKTQANHILHDVYCSSCGRQAAAWAMLTLADWSLEEFQTEVERRRG
jgi:hypothetical protein